jgi:hypothetical protein
VGLSDTNVKKIFSSETAWPNGAKLGIDGPWVCLFQNCVRHPHPPFKMAAVFKGNDYLPLKFASVSLTMGKQLVNFITCGCAPSALLILKSHNRKYEG